MFNGYVKIIIEFIDVKDLDEWDLFEKDNNWNSFVYFYCYRYILLFFKVDGGGYFWNFDIKKFIKIL